MFQKRLETREWQDPAGLLVLEEAPPFSPRKQRRWREYTHAHTHRTLEWLASRVVVVVDVRALWWEEMTFAQSASSLLSRFALIVFCFFRRYEDFIYYFFGEHVRQSKTPIREKPSLSHSLSRTGRAATATPTATR